MGSLLIFNGTAAAGTCVPVACCVGGPVLGPAVGVERIAAGGAFASRIGGAVDGLLQPLGAAGAVIPVAGCVALDASGFLVGMGLDSISASGAFSGGVGRGVAQRGSCRGLSFRRAHFADFVFRTLPSAGGLGDSHCFPQVVPSCGDCLVPCLMADRTHLGLYARFAAGGCRRRPGILPGVLAGG